MDTLKLFVILIVLTQLTGCGDTSRNRTQENADRHGPNIDDEVPVPRPNIAEEVLVPPVGNYNHSFEIVEEYDKFKDMTHTTVSGKASSNIKSADGVTFYGIFNNDDALNVDLSFVVYAETWVNLKLFSPTKKNDLIMLLDGKPTRFEFSFDSDVGGSGSVFESSTIELSIKELTSIVNAEKVEVQIGRVEFSLDNAALEALRDFASRLPRGTFDSITIKTDPKLKLEKAEQNRREQAEKAARVEQVKQEQAEKVEQLNRKGAERAERLKREQAEKPLKAPLDPAEVAKREERIAKAKAEQHARSKVIQAKVPGITKELRDKLLNEVLDVYPNTEAAKEARKIMFPHEK